MATTTLTQSTLDRILQILLSATADAWGDVADYYPSAEAESRRAAWDADADSWESAWMAPLGALPALADSPVDLSPIAAAIDLASRIEGAWGDDPATQEICAEIAAALDWEIRPAMLPEALREGDA